MEGMGGGFHYLDGNMSGEDLPPAQATDQPQSSSICRFSSDQLRKEVKKAVERELQSLPTIVIDVMKQMIPAIPPQLQSSTLPSASRSFGASRTWQLHIVGEPEIIFTCKKLHEQGVCFTVELRNEYGVVVKDGPESSATIKTFVLPGDFKVEDHLTGKDLSEHIVKVRAGKPQTLVGKFELALHQGVACFKELIITDNSNWMTDKKFRLGAKVVGGFPGVTIREAVSAAFRVKERRGEAHQKKETPSLEDPVCSLHCIGKDGKISQRLKENGINSVNDLLIWHQADEKSLKEILKVAKSTFQKIMQQAYSAVNWPTVSYGVQDATIQVSNDATNFAYGNQAEGFAVPGPNSQMFFPTQTIGAADISLSENVLLHSTPNYQDEFMQSVYNWDSETAVLYADNHDTLDRNSDTQDQAVRTFEEVRTKSSRGWSVIRAANRVIFLRRIVIMASTRPQKKPRISLDVMA